MIEYKKELIPKAKIHLYLFKQFSDKFKHQLSPGFNFMNFFGVNENKFSEILVLKKIKK